MTTFNHYHESEENIFHRQTKVFFSQSNVNKVISLGELLRITSDSAIEDYCVRNMSREMLLEHNYAILVSRCSYRFHRMPMENERVHIKTWEEKPEPLQLSRAYEIESENGEKLVSGFSTWLVVDPVKRRILPTKEFTLRKDPEFKTEHDCLKPGRIYSTKIEGLLEKWDERVIKFSDLDGNKHTNNARYGAFVEDAIPDAYREIAFTDFKLNYSKEAVLGQTLTTYGYDDKENKKLVFVGKTEEGISYEAELYYR